MERCTKEKCARSMNYFRVKPPVLTIQAKKKHFLTLDLLRLPHHKSPLRILDKFHILSFRDEVGLSNPLLSMDKQIGKSREKLLFNGFVC